MRRILHSDNGIKIIHGYRHAHGVTLRNEYGIGYDLKAGKTRPPGAHLYRGTTRLKIDRLTLTVRVDDFYARWHTRQINNRCAVD